MNLKNIFWNLAGLGFPVIAAALTIPWLIQLIGLERFGLLTIAWGMIGTSGLFDLGVGRATTQFVAKLLGLSQYRDIPAVVRSGVSLSLLAGIAAGSIFAIAILLGIHRYINASPGIDLELKWGALILAATLPLQSVSSTYRGINEAYADFRGISLVRIFLGVINFLGPFLVALVTVHLGWLMSTLLISRFLGLFIFRYLAITHIAEQKPDPKQKSATLDEALTGRTIRNELIHFGGWFTVGCGAAFVLNLSERVVIGVMLAAAAISAFAIPAEVVIQSLAIVTAISTIAFPQLSTLVHRDPDAALKLFHSWLLRVLGVMLVICGIMFLALPFALRIWVGSKLPAEATGIGQILCVGVLINTVSIMCFSMIHANGRADLPTFVRLIEVPLHLIWLTGLTYAMGVYGTAIAWVLRQTFDSAALYWVLRKYPTEFQPKTLLAAQAAPTVADHHRNDFERSNGEPGLAASGSKVR